MKGIIFDVQRWSLHDGPGIRSNIFLKGCPLSCLWCSNPESQDKNKELAFFKDKCIGCLCCIEDCHYGAITQGENGRRIDYKICKEHCYDEKEHSFSCVKECYAEALKIMGRTISVEQVMVEVLCDEEIYKKSGGGITVTGGEPFSKPEFLYEILKAAKAEKQDDQSELVPFWCFGKDQSVKIERLVPMYPMSKDEVNYERLIKILSLYRLTLGQARQEELLEYLFREFKDTSGLKELFIDLSPFSKGKEG